MRMLKEAHDLIQAPKVDFNFIDNLYTISERSLLLVAILGLLPTYILFPVYGNAILVWNVLLYLLLAYRFYCIALFKKDHTKYSLKIWHRKFTFGALMVSFLFGILGIIALPFDNNIEHHLFIIILLFGLSSGASSSFATDHRLSIQYITIILGSLVIGMLLYGTQIYWLMSMIILIYIGSKIFLTVQNLRQKQKINQQNLEICEVQKALKEKQNVIYNFVQEAPLAIFTYNTNLKIIDANSAHLKLFNSTKEEVIGLDIASLPDNKVLQIMKDALHLGSQIYKGPYLSKKGVELWIEITAFSFNDEHGDLAGGIAIINDRTKEHAALNELTFNAKHDTLTSLLNRRGLQEYMSLFTQYTKHETYYSLLFYLDLNKFKYVNDSLGHKAGDELLIAIADRLKPLITKDCIISRFGGDEFIVISSFLTTDYKTIDTFAKACTQKIQQIFMKPFVINGIDLSIQTSIGIVIIEPRYRNIEELIRYADIAMYQAKKDHNTHTSYYDPNLDKERKELFILQHDLAHAIVYDQLKVYLQPLTAIKDDRLIAAECLIRWAHPRLGLLGPDKFIPAAIETGMISTITWWIIEKVCREIYTLKNKNLWKLKYISVNIDAKQLLVSHFLDKLLSILNKYHVNASELMIEISEKSIIDNFEGTQEIMSALRKEGIRFAIDDFGIGYSSLSYLKKLSFDTLKIDREFIKDIQYRPDDIILIKTILAIGRQFHYDIVVEGVEDVKQKTLLSAIDPQLLYQGFLFEKPIPFHTFITKYLAEAQLQQTQ